jgi:hypothetical protein
MTATIKTYIKLHKILQTMFLNSPDSSAKVAD